MLEVLTPKQMGTADRLTIESGKPGIELMENAGRSVAETILEYYPDCQTVLVVCGTGNNGGDGYVAARILADAGKKPSVHVCGDTRHISGDAKLAFDSLKADLLAGQEPDFESFDLIVDALFGAGLDRPVTGDFAHVIDRINKSGVPVVAVDLPSGIDGATGLVMGTAVKANRTTTFFRLKPGHLLFPGRAFCGKSHLHQIGIAAGVLERAGHAAVQNLPLLWAEYFPVPQHDGHKYVRGHTLVVSGPPATTGAARLAAQAALRSGSGLVTVASCREALTENACHLTSVMLKQCDSAGEMAAILEDPRLNVVVMGPGMPPDNETAEFVLATLSSGCQTVLDAGALTACSADPNSLFAAIHGCRGDVVLTPHQGEFNKLFPGVDSSSSKLDKAREAALASGAAVVLKGPDTVVATPDGRCSIASNAPPWLATAGSGDVLCGIVAGLMAQGMPVFEAASAAVWLHGDAACRLGPGMISSDLDEGLRSSIHALIGEIIDPATREILQL